MLVRSRVLALAATVSALGLGACASSTRTVTITGPPTPAGTSSAQSAKTASTPAASAETAPPARVVHLSAFQSPSANIGCQLIDGLARCDIRRRSWSPPPRPASCPDITDFGQGLEVGGSNPARPASFVCAGDTAGDPSSPKLPYGSGSQVGPFLCVSRVTGMTCTDRASGHGFFISIQSYRIF